MKFLIIDDDIDSCQLLRKRLENYGVSDIATDGQTAFELFTRSFQQNEPYDVVFLDIVMPRMDGHEILVRIRNWEWEHLDEARRTRVVMVSVMKDTKNIFTSVQEGCDHYMTKPIRKSSVEEIMRKLGIKEQSRLSGTDTAL